MELLKIINNLPNLFCLDGATEEEIIEAERQLGVSFALDYKEYILKYGIITYDSHEITGLCNHKRLDVCKVTEYERKNNPNVSNEFYVIEQLDIDGVVIWQNSSGEIYRSIPEENIVKLYNSLEEYLTK